MRKLSQAERDDARAKIELHTPSFLQVIADYAQQHDLDPAVMCDVIASCQMNLLIIQWVEVDMERHYRMLWKRAQQVLESGPGDPVRGFACLA